MSAGKVIQMRHISLLAAFAVAFALPQTAWAAAEEGGQKANEPQTKNQSGTKSPLAEELVPWEGSYCPRPLHRATKLIIVTVDRLNDTKAELHTFERKSPASSWTKSSGPEILRRRRARCRLGTPLPVLPPRRGAGKGGRR